MWNKIALSPPPTNSFRGTAGSVNTTQLKSSLNDLGTIIKLCKDPLQLETSLLIRVLYKFKRRLRSHTEMNFLIKMKKHIERYFKIDLTKDIHNFLLSVPYKNTGDVYYPTKQMLEYMLVRIQGITKLTSKIIDLSAETAKYMISRLMLGHYWNFALTVLSIVSRIWEIYHHVIEACCISYQKLIPIKNQLQLLGLNWIKDDYIFPENLREWLELRWTLKDLQSFTQKKLDIVTYVLSDDEEDDDIQFVYSYKNDCVVIDDSLKIAEDDVEFVNEYIDIIATRNRSLIETKNEIIDIDNSDLELISEENKQTFDDDIGEIVERNNENILNETEKCQNNNNSVITKKRKKKNKENNLSETDDSVIEIPTKQETRKVKKVKNKNCKVDNIVVEILTSTPNIKNETEQVVKKKRKRKNGREHEIQNSVLESNRKRHSDTVIEILDFGTPKKIPKTNDNDSIISLSDSVSSEITQSTSNFDRSAILIDETNKISDLEEINQNTVINIDDTIRPENSQNNTLINETLSTTLNNNNSFDDSDIWQNNLNILCSTPRVNVGEHNLDNVITLQEFNKFLEREKLYRIYNKTNAVTARVSKSSWRKLMSTIRSIFESRKRLKQNKKMAVELAKDIMKTYIK